MYQRFYPYLEMKKSKKMVPTKSNNISLLLKLNIGNVNPELMVYGLTRHNRGN